MLFSTFDTFSCQDTVKKVSSRSCFVSIVLSCDWWQGIQFEIYCSGARMKLYTTLQNIHGCSVKYLCFLLKCIAKLRVSLMFRRRWSAVFLCWNLRSMTCVMFSGACFLYVTFSFQSWDFNILPHLLSKNWLLLLQNLKSELAAVHGRMP